jgi:hypothetical protein
MKNAYRARRRRNRGVTIGIVAAAAVVALGLAAWALVPRLVGPAPASCATTETYTVLADSTTLPAVNDALGRVNPAACATFRVDVADQAAIAAKVAAGTHAPDLWIADTSARVAAVTASPKPEIAVPSVASSPAVVARSKAAAAPATWSGVLSAPGLLLGDPLSSASAAGALAGAVAEGETGVADAKALAGSLGRLAQTAAQKSAGTQSDSALLDSAERSDSMAVVSESSWIDYASGRPGTKLASAAPGSGAALADYPIAVTTPNTARRAGAADAAHALGAALTDDAGRRALAARGLRAPGGVAPDGANGFTGTVKALAPSADALNRATKMWALQAVPFRSLVVMDVSGSMNADAGGKTRMQLTQEAATQGAGLFPDTAQLGMWAFSIGLGGNGQDYRELDPIRRMDAVTDGRTQRQRILGDISSLGGLVGGGTGLYDTALAAFRTVKASYDPRAVNSVILFTDGANEKASSISLDQLLATLAREKDPAKPVIFVTIGITADADEPVLKQIAAATGGSSYVAKDPADIPKVFSEALLARTQ